MDYLQSHADVRPNPVLSGTGGGNEKKQGQGGNNALPGGLLNEVGGLLRLKNAFDSSDELGLK